MKNAKLERKKEHGKWLNAGKDRKAATAIRLREACTPSEFCVPRPTLSASRHARTKSTLGVPLRSPLSLTKISRRWSCERCWIRSRSLRHRARLKLLRRTCSCRRKAAPIRELGVQEWVIFIQLFADQDALSVPWLGNILLPK
jgi:hypothetical protein